MTVPSAEPLISPVAASASTNAFARLAKAAAPEDKKIGQRRRDLRRAAGRGPLDADAARLARPEPARDRRAGGRAGGEEAGPARRADLRAAGGPRARVVNSAFTVARAIARPGQLATRWRWAKAARSDGDLIVGHVVGGHGCALTAQPDAAIAPRLAAVIGDLVAIPTARGRAYGVVNGLRKGRRDEDRPAVDIQLLGEAVRDARTARPSSAASPPTRRSTRRSWP